MQGNKEPPCVAVATANSILFYRNLRPYYRFALPQLYLHPPEVELWERALHTADLPTSHLYEGLKGCLKEVSSAQLQPTERGGRPPVRMQTSLTQLSDHTHRLLGAENDEARDSYLANVRNNRERFALSNVRLTCITTLKRDQHRDDAIDVLVAGAELGAIYWIDVQAYTVLAHTRIRSAPDRLLALGIGDERGVAAASAPIAILGLYDVESRTFVVTRDAEVVILKKVGRAELAISTFSLRSSPINFVHSVNQVSDDAHGGSNAGERRCSSCSRHATANFSSTRRAAAASASSE